MPNLVMARLLDYFGRRTDWQRRLWNPGTVTVLQETVEAVDLLHSGHLRERTVTGLAATAQRRAGPDRGVGPPAVRSALTAVLHSLQQAPANRVARHQLEHLLGSIEANYLGRWSDILAVEAGALFHRGSFKNPRRATCWAWASAPTTCTGGRRG